MPGLVAAGGLRLSHARLGGSGEDVPFAIALAGRAVTAHRSETDLLPSVSLLATPLPDGTLYARYQEGFRPGGPANQQDQKSRVLGQDGSRRLDSGVSLPHKKKNHS